jgi:hypothetical protein
MLLLYALAVLYISANPCLGITLTTRYGGHLLIRDARQELNLPHGDLTESGTEYSPELALLELVNCPGSVEDVLLVHIQQPMRPFDRQTRYCRDAPNLKLLIAELELGYFGSRLSEYRVQTIVHHHRMCEAMYNAHRGRDVSWALDTFVGKAYMERERPNPWIVHSLLRSSAERCDEDYGAAANGWRAVPSAAVEPNVSVPDASPSLVAFLGFYVALPPAMTVGVMLFRRLTSAH